MEGTLREVSTVEVFAKSDANIHRDFQQYWGQFLKISRLWAEGAGMVGYR